MYVMVVLGWHSSTKHVNSSFRGNLCLITKLCSLKHKVSSVWCMWVTRPFHAIFGGRGDIIFRGWCNFNFSFVPTPVHKSLLGWCTYLYVYVLQEKESKAQIGGTGHYPESPDVIIKDHDNSANRKSKWSSSSRHDNLPNQNKSDITITKSGKYTPVTVFHPKNLTFNFIGSGFRPRNRRRLSLGGRSCDPNKHITHSTNMNFLDFVDLFKSFSLRSRKDLNDLFDQFATTKPSIEKKLPKSILEMEPQAKDSGKLPVLCSSKITHLAVVQII